LDIIVVGSPLIAGPLSIASKSGQTSENPAQALKKPIY